MARIIDQIAQSTLNSTDVFLIDNPSGGTHKINVSDMRAALVGNFVSPDSLNAAGFHNSICTGRNLGTAITNTQKEEISAGTFEDLFIGDYWIINSKIYRIGDFNPFYNSGDSKLLRHHIAIIVDGPIEYNQMNNTESGEYTEGSEYNITEGSYINSDMRTENLQSVQTTIINDIGETNILSYRDLLPNAANSTGDSNWEWADCKVELMSETMVYGQKVWANNGYSVGCCNRQLSLFKLNPAMIHTGYTYWLRNASSAAGFSAVHSSGAASSHFASRALAIRPFFLYG